jgi:hypothetical protein
VSEEVDLGGSFDVSSISITNRWCALLWCCSLSGATLSLLGASGAVVLSFPIGDTWSESTFVYAFDAAPEFCQGNVSLTSIDTLT